MQILCKLYSSNLCSAKIHLSLDIECVLYFQHKYTHIQL